VGLGAAALALSWGAGVLHPQHLELADEAVVVPSARPWGPDERLPWEDVAEVRSRWSGPVAVLVSGRVVPLRGLPRGEAERLAERVRLARARPRR